MLTHLFWPGKMLKMLFTPGPVHPFTHTHVAFFDVGSVAGSNLLFLFCRAHSSTDRAVGSMGCGVLPGDARYVIQ